jgi:hypothetical protein
LKSYLGRFLEDRLVQAEIGNQFLQPGVLHLQLLQPLRLVHLHPAILAAPPIQGLFAHPNPPTGLGYRGAARHSHLNLTQLADDLFRRKSLTRHQILPSKVAQS